MKNKFLSIGSRAGRFIEEAKWLIRCLRYRRKRILKTAPLRCWLPLIRSGFTPDRCRLLPSNRHDIALYAGDLHSYRTVRIDWEYGHLLHDKLLFELVMREHVSVPRNLVWIRNGRPTWLVDEAEQTSSLGELLRREGALIVKPKDRNGGSGVELFEFVGDAFLRNGEEVGREDLSWDEFSTGERLVCEFVQQGEFARSLYPRTVNSLRILTMVDPDDGSTFVPAAYIRIGRAESFPTDNTSRGGYFCSVDVETGRLGKAVVDYLVDRPFQWVAEHPESGVLFENVRIPMFSDICQEMARVALKVPMLPYIAWDVALLDDGISVLEGNRWCDLCAFQMSEPLLADERVRRFFEYHNIL